MTVFLVGLVFFLALAGYSDADYCICNGGLSDTVLQRDIDYACGAGADCAAILQNGPCFNPNTVRDHCSYAVNSYFQKNRNAGATCSFQGTATLTPNPPSASPGCVYPSSASNTGGSTTPSTTPPGSTTPSTTPPTGGTPTTPLTPNTGGGTTSPGTFPGGGTTTTPGAVPGSPTTPGFSLAPTGTGFGNTDSGATPVNLLSQGGTFTLVSMISIILISSIICPMI